MMNGKENTAEWGEAAPVRNEDERRKIFYGKIAADYRCLLHVEICLPPSPYPTGLFI